MLHSCFSDSEDDRDGDHDDDDDVGGKDVGKDGEDVYGDGDDMSDVASIRSAAGLRNGVILARTALVARAQRVRVGSPGGNKGEAGGEW